MDPGHLYSILRFRCSKNELGWVLIRQDEGVDVTHRNQGDPL